MIEFFFVNAAGQTLFTRMDAETAHWIVQELAFDAVFPYEETKVIERGMRVAFRDPVTDKFQMFEIRQCADTEPDHGQKITAEHIAVAELSDDHIDKAEITNKTAGEALTTVLTGTLWSVGTNTASGTSDTDIARGDVWQAVNAIKTNWNVYITPRIVMSAQGQIQARYLDITPAGTTEILDSFGETTTGIWVNEHCHEYGFIRRYQLEYAEETGYGQEAWHYRYVGVELATYLHDNDMSLEAYYGLEQRLPWDE